MRQGPLPLNPLNPAARAPGLGGVWRGRVERVNPLGVSVPALTGLSQVVPNITAPAGMCFTEGAEVWVAALDGNRETLVVIAGGSTSFTTTNRPDPVAIGPGVMVLDTTLHIPIWSDGTVWRNSAGATV